MRSSHRIPLLLVALSLALAVGAPRLAAQAGRPAAEGGKELIAVMELEGAGASNVELRAITDRLREVLLKTGRFTLVDRSQMKALLGEQAFQQAGCTGQECAVKVGQILGVRKIVTGQVVKLASDAWQVSAMMLDVETAETLRADSIRFHGDILSLLDRQLPVLGAELATSRQVPVPTPRPPAVVPAVAAPVAPAPPPPPPRIYPMGKPLQVLNGDWSDAPPIPTGRTDHASVVLGDQVYVLGGNDRNNKPLDSVEVYDPLHNIWQAAPPLPTPRSEMAAAVLNGHIWVMGGTYRGKPFNNVVVFDPGAGTWQDGPPLPHPRKGALAATVGGKLLLVGGIGSDDHSTNEVLALQPGGTSWETVAPMHVPRGYATGQVADGKLYVFGGKNHRSGIALFGPSEMLHDAEVYDAASNRWSSLAPLPTGVYQASSVLVQRTVYLFGGLSGNVAVLTPQDRYWAYSLDSGRWRAMGRMPRGRNGNQLRPTAGRARHTSVALSDRVLLIGGTPEAWGLVSVVH
jgi:N-acetylneuraminic acid mutarotase